MADDPQVSVTTPTGGNENVPASVVDAPAGGLSYGNTGTGSNPTGRTQVVKLNPKLATASYPGVISAVAASEYRETAKDGSQVQRIKNLLAVLKAVQDGSIEKKGRSGLDKAALNQVLTRVSDFNGLGDPQATLIGGTTFPKATMNRIQKAAAQEVRIAYSSVGINTTATNYNALLNAGGKQLSTLEQQEASSRGATAPLAPLTRTNGLLTLLDDLEGNKPTTNVNPSVWQSMLSRAGVPGGGQGTGYMLATGNDTSNLTPGSTLNPQIQKAVEGATLGAIQTHMIDLGADPSEVNSANSAKALRAVQLPSHLHAMAGTDGYDLSHVTTMGSFFQELQKQSVQTKAGLGIPGQQIKTAAKPAGNGTGQQFFDAFKQQWQTNAAYRTEVASALTSAGVSPTAIGDTAADYASAANALQKVMTETPAGQNPWAYLKSQPQISSTLLHANPGYAVALAEATKIGAKLSNDQLNRLAQIYGGSDSTGNTDALDQAIAGLYRYDPNEDTQPGSFAATALQNVQQTFGSYGIELTNAQAGGYVQKLLNKGGADLTSIYSAGDAATAYAEDMAKQSASSLFPTLAPLINSGQTLTGSGGMLTPYMSQYAQMLGKDPDTVTLTPQLIKLMAAGNTGSSSSVGSGSVGGGGALQSQAGGGEKGATTAQGGLKSLDEFQAAVMQDPTSGWDKSPSAFESYANMSNTLLSTMGFAPPSGAQTPGAPQTSNLAGGQV